MVIKRHRKTLPTPLANVYYGRRNWSRRVLGLDTITRIPARREQLQTKERVEDEIYKLDLATWNICPDYHTWKKPLFNQFGTIISPLGETLGSLDGKRHFRGNVPNYYLWSAAGVPVEAQLKGNDGDYYYFELLEDKYEAERTKQRQLFDWYYGGRPGKRIRAPLTSFHNDQLIVAKFGDDTNRRCRFLSGNREDPIVVDLDSGNLAYAARRKLYPLDEQFLTVPYNAISTVIANGDRIIKEETIKENWEIFAGTETLKELMSKMPFHLNNWSYPVFLTNVKMNLDLVETFSVEVSLGEDTQNVLEFLNDLLLKQVKIRNENFQNWSSNGIGVTFIAKSGTIWLCHDIKLLESFQEYLNEPTRRSTMMHPNITSAQTDNSPSSTSWFKTIVTIPDVLYLVVDEYDGRVYRAIIVELSADPEWYVVRFIDTGTIKRLYSVKDFLSPLPHRLLPDYINKMPPLSTRFHLHGVRFVCHPLNLKNNLVGRNLSMKVEDSERTENIQDLYINRKTKVPSISVKVVSDEGDVTEDVNKKVLYFAEQQRYKKPYQKNYQSRFYPSKIEHDMNKETEKRQNFADRQYGV